MDKIIDNQKFVIYKNEENRIELDIALDRETIWMNLNQIANLFYRDKSVISRHIRNIFESKELSKSATVALFAIIEVQGCFN